MTTQPVILVVDDDEDDRLFIQLAFEENDDLNYPLAFATDGYKALEWLTNASELPVLVLLDINMPRLNGLEVLKKLRDSPKWRGLPVIMFTTSGEANAIAKAYDLGANSYVTKPPTYSDFGTLLRTVCHYWLEVAHVPGYERQRAAV